LARSLTETLADGYEFELEDRFDKGELDRTRWLPHHLPQWSSRAQSAARYDLSNGHLSLLIEEDQPPWCPELDGTTRVSSLQTGVFAGPVGSEVGQHRFSPDAVVREAQENARLFTPQFGVFVLRACAVANPSAMVALWMIGYEDRPELSAEICICEIFGRDVGPDSAAVGMGLHPFGDPAIIDDFEQLRLPLDATEPHEYAAEWTPERVTFFVDDRPVKTVGQSPQYPMQFMLGIYEFRDEDAPTGGYPKRFAVHSFRAYRPRD
jgi:Glycosyl hydrolases family 16